MFTKEQLHCEDWELQAARRLAVSPAGQTVRSYVEKVLAGMTLKRIDATRTGGTTHIKFSLPAVGRTLDVSKCSDSIHGVRTVVEMVFHEFAYEAHCAQRGLVGKNRPKYQNFKLESPWTTCRYSEYYKPKYPKYMSSIWVKLEGAYIECVEECGINRVAAFHSGSAAFHPSAGENACVLTFAAMLENAGCDGAVAGAYETFRSSTVRYDKQKEHAIKTHMELANRSIVEAVKLGVDRDEILRLVDAAIVAHVHSG